MKSILLTSSKENSVHVIHLFTLFVSVQIFDLHVKKVLSYFNC